MNYCSDCGATVSLKIPENDERLRFFRGEHPAHQSGIHAVPL